MGADIVSYLLQSNVEQSKPNEQKTSSVVDKQWGDSNNGFHLAGHADHLAIRLDDTEIVDVLWPAKGDRTALSSLEQETGVRGVNLPPWYLWGLDSI